MFMLQTQKNWIDGQTIQDICCLQRGHFWELLDKERKFHAWSDAGQQNVLNPNAAH